MDIAQLQSFADERHINLNVAHAFAALDPDTTYRPVGGMEHIELATPTEIAWASANVRLLMCEPMPDLSDESREERWRNIASALRVFTQNSICRCAHIENAANGKLLKRALEQGVIVQLRQKKHGRHGWPALYEWVGE